MLHSFDNNCYKGWKTKLLLSLLRCVILNIDINRKAAVKLYSIRTEIFDEIMMEKECTQKIRNK